MQLLSYSPHWFIWIDTSIWIIAIALSFASLIKGSDYILKQNGRLAWYMFRVFHIAILFVALQQLYVLFVIKPDLIITDLLRDLVITAYLIWRFIYKRFIAKDWIQASVSTTVKPKGVISKDQRNYQQRYQEKLEDAKNFMASTA